MKKPRKTWSSQGGKAVLFPLESVDILGLSFSTLKPKEANS
jgi:hypothetical protein